MATRVLVADDARFMRQAIRSILEADGFEVVGEAVDGRGVVEEYSRLQPDVVAVDVVMPDGSGVAVTREILASDPGARIVVMGAVGHEALVQQALDAGAADAVAKPFKPAAVVATLRKLIDREPEPIP